MADRGCLCHDHVHGGPDPHHGFPEADEVPAQGRREMNDRVELFRGNRIFLSCVYWAFVLYVFVPLILMVLMGFKDSNFIGFPIKSWTLEWYTGIFSDAEVLSTFAYSVA